MPRGPQYPAAKRQYLRALAAIVVILGSAVALSGCVVEERPWHAHYWHPY